jgi:hypothetical protein
LSSIYNDTTWQPWRFEHIPIGIWEDVENVQNFFEWIADELKIQSEDDWYRISAAEIASRGGKVLVGVLVHPYDHSHRIYWNLEVEAS